MSHLLRVLDDGMGEHEQENLSRKDKRVARIRGGICISASVGGGTAQYSIEGWD